ncbi:hypothetical protein CTheo_364 [Ceratobasidium theobromae]|uniref:Transmembrane protein n=1 Tax=Ceratobasidium theobromae TaxID=1582974 RepID=A0A5N5QWG0_9AGAM|nr:hypothetical protein CTheo_364 [Ceratobasidium theobromae]
MVPPRSAPCRGFVLFLIRFLRFILALYNVGLSIATIAISGIVGQVGGIIACIYIIPAAFALLALELGIFKFRTCISLFRREVQPSRIIALQFLSAVHMGVTWVNSDLFIAACVLFGLSVGLMNLIGLYCLLWGGQLEEETGVCSTSAKSHDLYLMSADEEALLFSTGKGDEESHLTGRGSEDSASGSGAKISVVE